jgi:glycosyltransferase involved in cell wall biosynthesis
MVTWWPEAGVNAGDMGGAISVADPRQVLVLSPSPVLGDAIKGGGEIALSHTVRALHDLYGTVRVAHGPALDVSRMSDTVLDDQSFGDETFSVEEICGPYLTSSYRESVAGMGALIALADLLVISDRSIGRMKSRGPQVLYLSNLAYQKARVAVREGRWAAIWVPSSYLAAKLAHEHAIPMGKIKVIPPVVTAARPGACDPEIARLRTRLRQARVPRERVLCFPHRADPEKGLLDALGMLGRLRARDRRWRLVVTAPSSFDIPANKRFYAEAMSDAARSGAAEGLEVISWLPHSAMNDLYSTCGCTIMATRLPESFGLVPLESLLSGCPVVATAAGALPSHGSYRGALRLVPDIDSADTAAIVARLAGSRVDPAAQAAIRRAYSAGQHASAVRSAVAALPAPGQWLPAA